MLTGYEYNRLNYLYQKESAYELTEEELKELDELETKASLEVIEESYTW